QQWPRGRGGHQLSRFSGNDGRYRSASCCESDLTAGADDRCMDGRRLLSQWRLPPELRLRLRVDDGVEQRECTGQLWNGLTRPAGRWICVLSRARFICRGCEAIGIESSSYMEAFPRPSSV